MNAGQVNTDDGPMNFGTWVREVPFLPARLHQRSRGISMQDRNKFVDAPS